MKRLERACYILAATSVAICLIVIGFLPKIVSTDWGKGLLIEWINNQTQGSLEIGSLHLSWFQGQTIKEINFKKEQECFFSLKSIESDCSFLAPIFRKSIGTTSAEQMRLIVYRKITHRSDKPKIRVAQKRSKQTQFIHWNTLSGTLNLDGAEVVFEEDGKKTLSFENLSMHLSYSSKNSPIALKAKGITKDVQIEGDFDFDVELFSKMATGYAKINHFPLEALNRRLSLKSNLLGSIGSNLSLNFLGNKGTEGVENFLKIISTKLNGQIDAFINKNRVTLKKQAYVNWEVSPTLFQTFQRMFTLPSSFEVISDGRVNCVLQKGQIDLNTKEFLAEGEVILSNIKWFLEPFKEKGLLDQFSVKFEKENFGEVLKIFSESTIYFEKYPPAIIKARCSLPPLSKANSLSEKVPYFDLNIKEFPIAFFAKLSSESSNITNFLGNGFDCKISKENKILFAQMSTPFFNLKKSQFQIDKEIELVTPALFQLSLQKSVYTHLKESIELFGTLEQLTLPLEKKEGEPLFKIKLTGKEVELLDPFLEQPLQILDSTITFDGKGLDNIDFNGECALHFMPSTWGDIVAGKALNTHLSGALNLKKRFEIEPVNVELKSADLHATLSAAVTNKGIRLKEPLKATFFLSPEKLNPLLKSKKAFILTKKAPIDLELKKAHFELNNKDQLKNILDMNCTVNSLEITDARGTSPTLFQNIQASLNVNEKKRVSTLDFKAIIGKKGQSTIKLHLDSDGFLKDLLEKPSKVVAQLSDVPSKLVDTLFDLKGDADQLIGPDFDLSYEMEKGDTSNTLNTKFSSEKLKARGVFILNDQELKLKDSLIIDWKGNEKFWNVIAEEKTSFKGVGDFALKGQAKQFILPIKNKGAWFPKFDFNLYSSLFDVTLFIENLKLSDRYTNVLSELKVLNLALSKTAKGGDLSFNIIGKTDKDSKNTKLNNIDFQGVCRQFFNPDGRIDFKNLSTSIKGEINRLPSVYLDALFSWNIDSDFYPSTLFGTAFNASINGALEKGNGHLDLGLKAPAFQASILSVIRDGIVYLKKPLTAKITITEQLSRALATNAKMTVIQRASPITIDISEKGFYLPLKRLYLKDLNFSFGRIEIGKLDLKNTGNINDVSDILKMDRSSEPDTSIWVAPVEMSMKNGLMYVDRTEILYNNTYEVATWGDVNFRSKNVDMVLGLTAQSLRAAFGIRNIDPDYVLKVPVEGRFGSIEINKKVALAKIALLVGQKHIIPKKSIWGNVLGAVGNLLDDQSNVPKAKRPFPWQTKS